MADYKYTDATPVDEPVAKNPKGASIMDKIRKYSPNQAAEVEESETATKKYGDAASKDFKEEKYGSAALNTAKGLGSAADTLLVKGPKAAAFAVRNRLVDGEKYAKGGSASSRADGCAERGKTKGTMIMCGGGMAKK
jgi:hypothetical protein